MNIFGVSLADSRNQLIAASFFGGTFISKSLFDRIVKPIVPSYEFSFLKSQTAVSLGLATYTTLKIMELAKLIPSVPLPFKIIGALSTFALMTSGLVKTMYSLKTADDLARRFNAMQQYCLSLKEQGKPFHCSIELINPQDSKPYLIHVIYKPQKDEKIKLFFTNKAHSVFPDTYLIISPSEVDPSTEKLLIDYLNNVFEFGQEGILTTTDLDIESVVVNEAVLERELF